MVAIGGASGSVYAQRLLDTLAAMSARDPKALEVGLCVSSAGAEVWNHEIGDFPAYPFTRYGLRDFRAPFASGSAGWDAMVVVPCSTGGLARIAHGISENLIERAADVMLKEQRRLIIVPRETPMSLPQLRNMVRCAQAGAMILPAMPAFYQQPKTLDDLADFMAGKILSALGFEHELFPPWTGKAGPD